VDKGLFATYLVLLEWSARLCVLDSERAMVDPAITHVHLCI